MSMNVTIATYADLHTWVDAFMKPEGLSLLFVVGDPGSGKSVAFKAKVNENDHRYIKAARLTTFQLYKQLFKFRNKTIVLDDVEDPLRRSDMARLLMALCETDDTDRTVAWFGTESLLKVQKGKKVIRIPQEFETASRVCLICNDWAILTGKFGALLDRGTVLFFDPDSKEIHRFVGDWFQDEEIYKFIEKNLSEVVRHSIRYYIIAQDQKRLGLDWKTALRESWISEQTKGTATEKLVKQLLADPTYKTDKERVEAFMAHPDGRSRRTWFLTKKKLGI